MSENNFSEDEKKLIEELAKPISFKEYFTKMDESERRIKISELIQNIITINTNMNNICNNMIKVSQENNTNSTEDKKQEE